MLQSKHFWKSVSVFRRNYNDSIQFEIAETRLYHPGKGPDAFAEISEMSSVILAQVIFMLFLRPQIFLYVVRVSESDLIGIYCFIRKRCSHTCN